MSKIIFRHIAFFRVTTHRGVEVFQLLVQSDDMGLDRLIRNEINNVSSFDVVDEINNYNISSISQIVIYDFRRRIINSDYEILLKRNFHNSNIALIDPESCNRQDVYKSGFSDFLSWPVLGPELYMRLLAQCRSLSFNDRYHLYSRVALVERCCGYLVENIAESLPIRSLARMFNTNHNTLNAAFKREMGLPPSSWQRKMRLEAAAHQLVTTDLPVHVIAERFGYELAGNFATAFRRHFNTTPQRYRRAGLKNI